MTINIGGHIYYSTGDVCKKAGISRATLFRWLKAGILDKYHKNRRGWRIYTEEDLIKIKAEVNKIKVEYSYNETNIQSKG